MRCDHCGKDAGRARTPLCAACRRITEAQVQEKIKSFWRSIGGFVNDYSQGYRPGGRHHGSTRQTEGVADLLLQHEGRGVALFWETKRPGQEQSGLTDAQRAFERRNEACGIPSGHGGWPEFVAKLQALGFTILR
jgi:hypothetical protein